VPVSLDDLLGRTLDAYQFDLYYDPSVLTLDRQAATIVGTMSENLTLVYNSPRPGLLKIAVYGPVSVTGDGIYLDLHFKVAGDTGSSTSIVIDGFRFNDGRAPIKTKNGLLKITGQG
jgi:hypothetical protein